MRPSRSKLIKLEGIITEDDTMTWLSITKDGIMREELNAFTTELGELDPKYKMYDAGGKNLYIKTSKKAFDGLTDSWFVFHPISMIKNKPNVSDYDLIE